MYCQEPCKKPYKSLICLHGLEITFQIKICHKNIVKYEVKLDKNKNNNVFKKNMVKKFKIFFIRHCSPTFHSIEIYSLHEGDPLFLAVKIHSVCGTLHVFPMTVNIFLVSAVDFGVYFMETCESTLAEGRCSTKIENSRYLVCVCLILHLCLLSFLTTCSPLASHH
jgi:hypothetical protein